MRLLECYDDGEFCFTDFQNDNIPPYAILSHTWVEGQEVTFEDMTAGKEKGSVVNAQEGATGSKRHHLKAMIGSFSCC
jgi:hypothetical protein